MPKKRCGLLGEKLSHSYSPLIHSMLGDYEYLLYEKRRSELSDFLLEGKFDGLNVTIPYKKSVIPYCSSLSERARKIGSVNTIVRLQDKTLHGDNTDYFGFQYMLHKAGISPEGKKALVLGSGGASLTVQAVLYDMGAKDIIVISRGGEHNYGNIQIHEDAQIIVNTTPVGMYPHTDAAPVSLSCFPTCEAVLDLIYNPEWTVLLSEARDKNIPCAGGLVMLAAQAKKAAEIFTDTEISDEVINSIVNDVLRIY